MEKIRVLIVDDSFFMRKVIRGFLESDPGFEVVGEAADGTEALEQIPVLHPRVITLDIEMPKLNGLETLRAIVQLPHHPSVVMVSGYVKEGEDITLQSLQMGAADFVLKPSGSFSLDMDKVRELLIEKVKIAAQADTAKIRATNGSNAAAAKPQHYPKIDSGIVIIGASTGGPAALEALLPQFPSNFPYPIVIAQHLPKAFTESFTDRLQRMCQLDVVRAEPDSNIIAGTIYIAAGSTTTTIITKNDHPIFKVEGNTHDIETPPVSELMASAADVYQDKTIGIILTGMGTDGLTGMGQIKHAGGQTIVQDKSTSAVFGMGREVVQKGLADNVVPLDNIMTTVSKALKTL
jgi:two-component system chemotaxis response regulator CheB